MNDYLNKVFIQLKEFYGSLSAARKAGMFATGLGIIAAMSYLFMWAGEKSFRPLMTNLSNEDSSAIIRVLREKNIPFKVSDGGKTVEIPPESVMDLRLELATMGLPENSVVGYELFDKQSLGTTSFVQGVNQKRALEGELMRTIGTMKGIKRSRIHLAIPKKSAFVEDQKKPSASVVLDMDPGIRLNDKQVYGIGVLVANAVEGMEVADVVIVDSNGKTLSKESRDPLVALSASQMDFQRKFEEDTEKRVEALLTPVVGEGRVVARVSAELDFSQVTENQTLYDPDGAAVRSTERTKDVATGNRPGPYGVAGVRSNEPGAPPAPNVNQISQNVDKDRSIINYAVPQTIRRTTKPMGSVQKLSVAVVVDAKLVKTQGEDGKVLSKVEPWPPEKIAEFESIIASAVGLNKKRGDSLDVKTMEFTREDFEAAEKAIADSERRTYIQNLLTWGVVGLIIVLFFFLVVRPFIRWVTENTIDSVDSFLPQTIEELEKLQANTNLPAIEESVPVMPEKIDPDKVEGEMIKEKIITLVDSNPHKAALVLKEWIKREKPAAPEQAAQA